jgi:hypothetical protein
MKFTNFLFTFLGLLVATVAALPSPIYLRKNTDIQSHNTTNKEALDFVREDDPVFSRYFESTYEISERDFAAATVEPRWVTMAAEALVEGVMAIVNLIQGKIEKDKTMRSQWTHDMIGQWRKKYPGWNFVFCHTKHKFEPKRGTPSGHLHKELKVSFGKTIGYEIYWFKEGTFRRIGDGGWLNWSYAGNIKHTSSDGKVIEFAAPK